MRSVFVSAAVLLIILSGLLGRTGRAGAESVHWATLEDELAIVHYDPGYLADAKRALTWVAAARAGSQRALAAVYSKKVNVWLYPTESAFGHSAGYMNADYKQGAFYAVTPSAATYDSYYDETYYRKNFTHEYSHLVVAELRSGQYFATWFHEGLAEYVSIYGAQDAEAMAKYSRYENQLRDQAQNGGAYLMQVNSDVYAGSSQVVRFMYLTFGQDKMNQLVRGSGTFEETLQKVLGINPRQLEDAWLKYLSAQYQIPLRAVTGNPGDMSVPVAAAVVHTTEVTRTLDLVRLGGPVFEKQTQLRTVLMTVGSTAAEQDRRPLTLQAPPIIQNDRTYVPLRAVAEALGAEVRWDELKSQILVTLSTATVKETTEARPDVGAYIIIRDEQAVHGGQADPYVLVYATTTSLRPAPELASLIQGGGLQPKVMADRNEIRSGQSEWAAGQYAGLVRVTIPMVPMAGGGWRSMGLVRVKEDAGITYLLGDRLGHWVEPAWEFGAPLHS